MILADAGPTGANPAALRVVLVEDSPFDARLVTELLSAASPGAEILVYSTVREATRELATAQADCILLDLGLPDADELEGLERVIGVARSAPIVVLTGRDDDRLALEAVRRGAQDYVIKRELDATLLTRTIGRAIERARLARQFAIDALHDGLTGLPDRVLFHDRLDQAIARSQRERTPFAIAFMDIDGFKAVNDRFGHAVGDEVLVAIAARLAGALRGCDTACRYGGDEFAALCDHTSELSVTSRIAMRLHDGISQRPVPTKAGALQMSVSIGMAHGTGAESAAELVRRADAAMYRAKSSRAPFAIYDAAPLALG